MSGKQNILPVRVDWMNRRCMPEVLKIERQSFEFPWSEDDFIFYLRQRNCVGITAEYNKQVLGFMIYELYKEKFHVFNFAVAPQSRRQKIGAQMIMKLIRRLDKNQRHKIALEVCERNLTAQLFFRANGFRAVSIFRDFYDCTTDDAYLMEFSLFKKTKFFAPANRISQFFAG